MKGLIVAVFVYLSFVRSGATNLTLFEIEPCAGATVEYVSRFKSDIYAVKPNFSLCANSSWWPPTGGYSNIVRGWQGLGWLQLASYSSEGG